MLGFAGLAFLFWDTLMAYPEISPLRTLVVALPDLVIFFLAYRTYPADDTVTVKTAKVKSY